MPLNLRLRIQNYYTAYQNYRYKNQLQASLVTTFANKNNSKIYKYILKILQNCILSFNSFS